MYRSPISRVGGKFYLAPKIISLFPEHNTYVEVFGGAAHILFRKPLSAVEIYNDIDGDLVNFFRVVTDREQNPVLAERIDKTLYAREVFDECMDIEPESDIDRACCFAIINRMSFGGKMGTWGVSIQSNSQTKAFYNAPKKIIDAFERLKNVQIEHKPFEYILNRYDRPATLFYLDPPYPFTGARGSTKLYKDEMTDADHMRMLDMLLKIRGKAILSGYDTPLYAPLEAAGWERISVGKSRMMIKKCSGEARPCKEEFVWKNF